MQNFRCYNTKIVSTKNKDESNVMMFQEVKMHQNEY